MADDGGGADARIEAFRAFVREEPDDSVARFGLAQALLGAGRFAEAADEFETALRLSPKYTAAYRGLGRAYEGAGRRDDAVRAYEAGTALACETGDLQAGHEMEVFLRRLRGE